MRQKKAAGLLNYTQSPFCPLFADGLPYLSPNQQVSANDPLGDLWEERGTDWEAAWIDLGGEG